ncbi:MAG: ComF family protein [Myxococcota bacterium]|nr:ComF family protein [Myxococcota bacterium]
MTIPLARDVIGALSDLIWPPRCAACGVRIASGPLTGELTSVFCRVCAETIVFSSDPVCTRCGIPFEGAGPSHKCGMCSTDVPAFRTARAPFLYGGAVADAIRHLKYGSALHLARPLGQLLAHLAWDARPNRSQRWDMVIPVPLFRTRLRARGFNQSALLARYLAKAVAIPLCTDLLVRVRDTGSQAGLTRVERRLNVNGAFRVPRKKGVLDRRIILFDDVITSTATVREAARTLSRSGAHAIDVIAFARATGCSF